MVWWLYFHPEEELFSAQKIVFLPREPEYKTPLREIERDQKHSEYRAVTTRKQKEKLFLAKEIKELVGILEVTK